jgi:cob(I)alamin adenosyltransferase
MHGRRVPKDHPQVEALGAFDELNVEVGAARMLAPDAAASELLASVQASLIRVMGEIACAEEDEGAGPGPRHPRIGQEELDRLDRALGALEREGIRTDGWATPGSNPAALALDRARVAARRAERRLAALPACGRRLRPLVAAWTNRLSDVLWLLARKAEPGA